MDILSKHSELTFSVTATILGHKLRLMQRGGKSIGKWIVTFLPANLKLKGTMSEHKTH